MFDKNDIAWMNHAILLAKNGLCTTRQNPRVGCVLVKNGEKIAQGWHEFPGGPHAEVNALAQAGVHAKGATCYVSLGPCTHFGKTPPCTEALIKAGVARVIAGSIDPNPLVDSKTKALLNQAGIQFEAGLCEEQARALNPGFFMRMQNKRPFVRLKTAMSLDGRTAMQNGQSQWITGPKARARVQLLRAQSTAIITGINSVLIDNPSLNVRDEEILKIPYFEQPIRVILDSQLRMPLDAKLLSLPGEVWIYTAAAHHEKSAQLQQKGAKIYQMPLQDEHISLSAVLNHLAQQQVNEVLVEAGHTLNGAFLQENLVDEWYLFVAPKIMGDAALGLCTLPGLTQLSQAVELKITQHFQVGEDWCYIATPNKGETCSQAS